MSGFANVFGASGRGSSVGAADALDSAQPSPLARRKLDDARKGLGAGVPDYALKTLQSHPGKLDRPLLVELAGALADSLAGRGLKDRRDPLRELLALTGCRPEWATQLAAFKDPDGAPDVPTVHILADEDASRSEELAGRLTVCERETPEGARRVRRGDWLQARRRYNRPYYHVFACSQCAARADEFADCAEEPDFPLLSPEGFASARERAAADIRKQLAETLKALTPDSALALARDAADAAVAHVAAASAADAEEATARRALRDGYDKVEALIRDHHQLTPADCVAPAEKWEALLREHAAANPTGEIADPQQVVDAVRALVLDEAAARSGRAAAPAGTDLQAGADATARVEVVDGEADGETSDAEQRAKVQAALKRI